MGQISTKMGSLIFRISLSSRTLWGVPQPPRLQTYTPTSRLQQHKWHSGCASPNTKCLKQVSTPGLLRDLPYARAISVLARVLETLAPRTTALLPNYPNPFNPETWIPYQLAAPAHVAITIYSANGQLVRTLELGQQAAGVYESRSRSVHWDGRNELGEQVASGVYFYVLTAGDFTATRKMLIRK